MAISKITSAGVDPNSIATNGANGAIDVNASAPADSLVISSAGNVGIGTSSPSYLLDVRKGSDTTLASFSGASSGRLLTISSFQVGGSPGAGYTLNATSGDGTIAFATNNTERARFLANGPLRIGDLTDDLFAGNNQSGISLGGNGYATLRLRRGADTGSCALFYGYGSSSSAVGGITVSNTGTAFNTTSDYRLKENVAPMTGALATVAALKPCTYTWKADGSSGQGFIAHELQAVVPDCVHGEKDAVDAEGKPVYQGIDTSFLVATLTAAIQELKAINDTQAQTIEALTARIEALENPA